jgi:hypothetical protein
MDPVTIGSATIGLLAAASRLGPHLFQIVTHAHDAPKVFLPIRDEMKSITAALKQLQVDLRGDSEAKADRLPLQSQLTLESTLTACMVTFSELENVIEKCIGGGNVKKIQWLRREGNIGELLNRMQAHKSSLTL